MNLKMTCGTQAISFWSCLLLLLATMVTSIAGEPSASPGIVLRNGDYVCVLLGDPSAKNSKPLIPLFGQVQGEDDSTVQFRAKAVVRYLDSDDAVEETIHIEWRLTPKTKRQRAITGERSMASRYPTRKVAAKYENNEVHISSSRLPYGKVEKQGKLKVLSNLGGSITEKDVLLIRGKTKTEILTAISSTFPAFTDTPKTLEIGIN